MVRLDTGEKVAFSVCDFDLFFVAEKYIFIIVVHEVDRIDRLVVRWSDWKEFAIVSDIIYVKSGTLANTKQ